MWMKTKVKISKALKPKERVDFAQAVISYIQNRTLDGIDKNGDKFHNYTKSYAAHKGVGVSDVDLALSSEMLSDLKLLSHSSGELTIGYDKGSKSNAKAEGNIKGTYGHSSPVTKGRDFLGVSPEEVQALMGNLDMGDDFKGLTDAQVDELARKAAKEVLGEIDFDE